MLDGNDAAGGETATVANAVDVVDDRHGGVAGAHEIGVEGMGTPPLDGARRGDESLADDLPAEDPLPADLGAQTAEQVVFQLLEVEYGKECLDGARHRLGPPLRMAPAFPPALGRGSSSR